MKLSSTLILLFFAINLMAQFPIGSRTLSFTDPSRSNRNVTAEVYYPATSAGANTTVATGEFPVLAFGHGFVMSVSAYDLVWQGIVPEGYIMILPTTEGAITPNHGNFGRDLAFLISKMRDENLNAASPFFGKIAATSAVMGHSMGGGSAFLAAEYDTTITAIATLAAANTNPPSIAAATNVAIPALVFAGVNDCVTPPAQHQIPMYDSLATDCKTYISIDGASHCQFANSNFFCSTGEATCQPAATISRTVQLNTVFTYLLPWLDYQLKADTAAGNNFQTLLLGSSGISYEQNCSLTTVSGIEELNSNDFSLMLQQNTDFAILRTDSDIEFSILLSDISGRILMTEHISNSNEYHLDLSNLNKGFYCLNVQVNGKTYSVFKILR
jgi:predicted dienelactone hydrolase